MYTNNDQLEEVLEAKASIYNRNNRVKILRINVTRIGQDPYEENLN